MDGGAGGGDLADVDAQDKAHVAAQDRAQAVETSPHVDAQDKAQAVRLFCE